MTGSPLPQDWNKTIILIMHKMGGQTIPLGTGFLLQSDKNIFILVTCKHIVIDTSNNIRKDIHFGFMSKNRRVVFRSFSELETKGGKWFFHSQEDIAVTVFAINIEQDDLKTFPEGLVASSEEIEEGEEVLYLGYPLGIAYDDNIKPLVRGGIIALKKINNIYLLDANVSPGNSGSPVFFKPSIVNWKTRSIGPISIAKFIGMISSYLPMSEPAISPTTGRTRIIFEENSGLAKIIGWKYIEEVINSKDFIEHLNNYFVAVKTPKIN